MIRLRKYLLFMVVLAVFALFYIGCEGPAGADGADGADGIDGLAGADGVDGNVTCLVCHSDENLEMKKHEFANSQHYKGDIAVAYAGGRSSCSPCHSHEQFVAFAEGFTATNISNPSPWKCSTCHGLHQTFESEDYALRVTEAVSVSGGSDFALKGTNYLDVEGNSNLCAVCHQARRAGPTDMGGEMVDLDDDDVDETLVPTGSFFISSTHYGPHHGAQANVVAGVGFPEMGTGAFPAAGSSYHIAASCTGCHMYEGNHDFEPDVDACNECHATTDFDYGSVQTDIEEKLEELRDLLVAAGVVEYQCSPSHL